MPAVVHVDASNFDREYVLSSEAIRDFLYTYFEISGDCLPAGDWTRAELGKVDPFRFLDIEYCCPYQFRSSEEVQFIHQGAAVNLLCRVAEILDKDECSGSALLATFNAPVTREIHEPMLRQHASVLFRIHDAFRGGCVAEVESIQQAFDIAFSSQPELLWDRLRRVREDVIMGTFMPRDSTDDRGRTKR